LTGYYRLTGLRRRVLAAEVARLEAVVRALGFSDDDTDPTMRLSVTAAARQE